MDTDLHAQIRQRYEQLPPVAELLREKSAEAIIDDLRLQIIEQQLVQQALREQLHRHQQVFEQIPLACAIFDRNMNYVAVNERWISDHRPSAPDLIGKNHYDIVPEVTPEWKEIHQRCLEGDIDMNERVPLMRSDGTTDWLRWNLRPWNQIDGAIGGLVMFTEFTTPIVHIEEEAHLYWERYQQLFAASPLGMVFLRLDSSIVQANDAFAKMFGYQPDEVLSLSLVDLTAQDNYEPCVENIRALFYDEIASFSIEKVFHKADGGLVWSVFHAIPVRDMDGRVMYLLGMFDDITERKNALAQLEASEARYRSVVEGQTDLICRYAPDFTLTFVNDAYGRAMAKSREELIGQNRLEMIALEDQKQVIENVRRIKPDQPLVLSEYRSLMPDGSIRWYQWKDSVVLDQDDTVMEYQAVGRDITERKLIEEALYFVAQRGWTAVDGTFFKALVNYLSQIFNLSYVFIGQLQPDRKRISTIAFSEGGTLRPNILYDLEGAPCQNVVGHTLCCYPMNVQELFPEDLGLVQLGVEGYMGIPLWDSNDNPLGIIVIMDRKPLEHIAILESVLQIVAVRAAHEMEQMVTEQALQESETRYRMVVNTLAEGVFMLDAHAKVLTWNHRALELLQMEEETFQTFMTDPLRRLHYLDEAGNVLPPERFPPVNTLRTGQVHTDLIVGIHYVPHQLRWFIFNTEPLFREENTIPYAVVCSFSDVTAERLAQERIIASEKRFRTLVENAPLAIIEADTGGKIRTANHMAAQLSGYPLEALAQSAMSKLIPDWRPTHLNGSESDDEIRYLMHADHSLIPVELASSQVMYDGSISDILFLNDIRSRLRADEERHKAELLAIELEKERDLRELKTRFITMVSHEFRTPMAIIMTSTAYIRRVVDLNPVLGERLSRIDEQIKRLARLMEDVTTLNKWDLIPVEVRPQRLNIRQFLKQMADDVLLIFPERQTDLTLDCIGDTITMTDDALLHQICGNLLTNALKYSQPGTPVSLRCESFPDELRISVHDQGIGIPPKDREFLFESFRRASNVENISGTGLGLAIVKRATDALHGSVQFTTELGVGTTFEVILPSVTRDTFS